MLRRIFLAGLKTGLALTATTTAAIMLFGKRERGSPWASVNAITHIIDGDPHTVPRRFSPRESAIGLALNGAAMLGWAMLFEGGLALTGARRNVATAGLMTAAIWTVDFHLVPARFSPGFERVLGFGSLLGTYAILGATLAASKAWESPSHSPRLLGGIAGDEGRLDEGREEAWFV